MSAIQMRCDDCGGEYMAGMVGSTPWPRVCPRTKEQTMGGRDHTEPCEKCGVWCGGLSDAPCDCSRPEPAVPVPGGAENPHPAPAPGGWVVGHSEHLAWNAGVVAERARIVALLRALPPVHLDLYGRAAADLIERSGGEGL